MNLRSKFTILLGGVIAATIAVATSTIYWMARIHLEKSASIRLQDTAALVSAEIEERFERLLENIQVWAQIPVVQKAVLEPHNESVIHEVNSIFAQVVASDPILQTFNLYDTQAVMIASSIPERINVQITPSVVAKRQDFIAALSGKSSIKGPFMALSSGQPIVSLTVPVFYEGRVIGVLRPIVLVAKFNEHFLKPLAQSQEGEIFIFAPDVGKGEIIKPLDPTVAVKTPYVAPDIPAIPDMKNKQNGIVEYVSKGKRRYAAFQWLSNPQALVIVELPLSEVLSPIQNIKYAALTVALMLLLVIGIPAGMAIRPMLSNLRKCLEFAHALQNGRLQERIAVSTKDDVGELAHGLNEMANRLERQHNALKDSEMKYRSIFNAAVEGIFQTRPDGKILAANPAFCKILGVDSPDTLRNYNAYDFYKDPQQRNVMMDLLRKHHEISGHEIDILRLDGCLRKCLVWARAQVDQNGQIKMLQGIMHDVTDERSAEAERKKAEKAQQLALEARFKALRFQVNPHFLFNVLNSMDALSRKSPERITDVIKELSVYLRHTLRPDTPMIAPLEEEVWSIQSYLAIEQIRFKDYLGVTFDISPEALKVNLPDMILQPLVENAVKYGMRTSPMPLRILINAKVTDNRLMIFVNNTGAWMAENNSAPRRAGIGLVNLRERLDIFYGPQFGMDISSADGWVRVMISLPLEPSFNHSIAPI